MTYEFAGDCEFARSELRACGGVRMHIGLGFVNTRIFENRFDGLEQGGLEGKKWIIKRQTNDIPGIEKAVDL